MPQSYLSRLGRSSWGDPMLFTAVALPLIQPDHPILDNVSNLWLSIAQLFDFF